MTMAMHQGRAPIPRAQRVFYYDRWCLLAAIGLILIGVLMVASSSIGISEKQYHQPFYFLTRQTIYLAIGFCIALFTMRTEVDNWFKVSSLVLLLSFILLVAVLVPGLGHVVNGSRRWLGVGPIRLQVSEVVKVLMIIYLSGYLVRHAKEVRERFSGFLKPMFLISLIAILLLGEPDFGAMVVITLSSLGMLFMAGVRLQHFFLLLCACGGAIATLAITSPYRLARLTSFLDPWSRQFDSGYQLTQSLIAFGRGGWFGTGLGESVQKLFYLPEAHNDFLFAIMAEELGLVGTVCVISLFGLLIFRGLVIARRAMLENLDFAGYLAYGLTFLLGFQALINIGVNSGMLPTKGLTLPFMSYGGSSMLMNCLAIALLLRIDYETRRQKFALE